MQKNTLYIKSLQVFRENFGNGGLLVLAKFWQFAAHTLLDELGHVLHDTPEIVAKLRFQGS